ncbi:HAMP domain-containing histidine kinase [candidate division KSB1 bacterium]|nr:HAMP domain-containing histidine kinase [candidate division KSB1 bacterium]
MKPRKKIVAVIISLITLALVGLICWQIYILNHVFELEQESFRQNVNAALGSIIQKLEAHEVATKIFKISVAAEEKNATNLGIIYKTEPDSAKEFKGVVWMQTLLPREPFVHLNKKDLSIRLPEKQRIKIILVDSTGKETKLINEVRTAGEFKIQIPDSLIKSGQYQLNIKTDSLFYFAQIINGEPAKILKSPSAIRRKQKLVEKVVDELTILPQIPITSRIDLADLDSLVNVTLAEKGITLPAAYGIMATANDSLIHIKPAIYQNQIRQSEFRSRLFPHDLFMEKNDLMLYFPNQKNYLIRQFGFIGLIALSFIVIIICCFVYVLKLIFEQKRFSNLLTDFINNMTHEFKTPISTISLASETITNPTIVKDEKRVLKYGQIIHDESFRMRHQVEKILQMAILEEGDYEYSFSQVNVHELIQQVAQKFAVKIEQLKGELTIKLKAEKNTIDADSVHLENIIHNLLDNAIKYTHRNPQITIETAQLDDQFQISIADNGIGIQPEEQKRVFEKYYRVPTGNVHDVKGFGLGLSYVKLIVEAHQGTIRLNSKVGKGTKFIISLPFTQKN